MLIDFTRFVTGFLFNQERTHVVLIQKRKPEWQRGKLNGVGGKLEPGESAPEAMRREFLEEAGVDVASWAHFATISGEEFSCDFFCAFDTEALLQVRTMEAEPVSVYPVLPIPGAVVPNLHWLLPMALHSEHDFPFDIVERAKWFDVL